MEREGGASSRKNKEHKAGPAPGKGVFRTFDQWNWTLLQGKRKRQRGGRGLLWQGFKVPLRQVHLLVAAPITQGQRTPRQNGFTHSRHSASIS